MSWRDLIIADNEHHKSPWLGGRILRSHTQKWMIEGQLPVEHGWYNFKLIGRKATTQSSIAADPAQLKYYTRGYLVGDRIAVDSIHLSADPASISRCTERVHLLDPDLDRFARVSAGRPYENGPLVFIAQDMPLGPEDDVLKAFYDRAESIDRVKGVSVALDAAFRMETYQRTETERRRVELEKLRREEEARRELEERRAAIVTRLGSGEGRRELAKIDFAEAAKAALTVGEAELLDWKRTRDGEYIVKYRLDGARYECVCDDQLRIVDAGICLTSHDTGIKGDTLFTLESLPNVVRQADREGVLVVFRHV